MKKESFTIIGANGEPVRGDIFLPPSKGKNAPCIVFCHGFKGFKDWGGWPYMAARLAEHEFAVILFNYSHNGVGEDLLQFTELEKFSRNTFSREVEDLQHVVNSLRNGGICHLNCVDSSRLGIIGHSRGAFAAIVGGSRVPGVKGIVTLAAISRMSPVSQEEKEKWRLQGVRYVRNVRTGQELPLGVELLDDMERQEKSIEQEVKKLRAPLLIIHGDEDEAVPLACAHELSSWATTSQLKILQGAGHTFGIQHPFVGSNKDFDKLISMTVEFFNETVK